MPFVTLRRPRPLPASIAVMAVLLFVKAINLLQADAGPPTVLTMASRAMIPPAQASGHPAAPTPHKAPAPASAPGPGPAATPQAPAMVQQEPAIPDSERAVLLELRSRRQAIETREQTLVARESVLAAAERRIGERVDQLTALQSRLEQLEARRREQDDANWRGLTKTYEAMRPKDAATILSEMDNAVLLQVLDRMKEAKAAMVLAAMSPDRARSATTLLAQMRSTAVASPNLADTAGKR